MVGGVMFKNHRSTPGLTGLGLVTANWGISVYEWPGGQITDFILSRDELFVFTGTSWEQRTERWHLVISPKAGLCWVKEMHDGRWRLL